MVEEARVRPCDLTAAEAAARFRTGALTPTALMASLLDQTRRLEPSLKAWAWLDEERALEAARHAEEELARGGRTPPPPQRALLPA